MAGKSEYEKPHKTSIIFEADNVEWLDTKAAKAKRSRAVYLNLLIERIRKQERDNPGWEFTV